MAISKSQTVKAMQAISSQQDAAKVLNEYINSKETKVRKQGELQSKIDLLAESLPTSSNIAGAFSSVCSQHGLAVPKRMQTAMPSASGQVTPFPVGLSTVAGPSADGSLPLERLAQVSDTSTQQAVMARIDETATATGKKFSISAGNTVFGSISFENTEHGVHINSIENYFNQSIRGVGTALLETAIRHSFNSGHDGRVTLDAVNSHRFYLRSGFVCDENKNDMDDYAQALQAQHGNRQMNQTEMLRLALETPSITLWSVFLELSDDARNSWRNRLFS